MTTINQDEYMKDRKGRLVPISQISDYDLAMDSFVREQVAAAKAKNAELSEFKDRAFNECYAWLDLVAEKFGRTRGGAKGNVSLVSFDGRYKLLRAVGEHRVFDERIQTAKALIDECIAKWSEGAQSELKALVEHAFRVSKQGHIDVNQVLSLRQISIDDSDWKAAMDAIADAIQITGTSQYLRMYERQGDGKYQQIPLDSAKV